MFAIKYQDKVADIMTKENEVYFGLVWSVMVISTH